MTGGLLLSYILLWIVIVVLVLIVVGMLRQIGQLQLQLKPQARVLLTDDGLPLAESAPSFQAREVQSGALVHFPSTDERGSVVIFVSPTCQPCQELVPDLGTFWSQQRTAYNFFVVCTGSLAQVREFVRLYGVAFPLLHDAESAISEAFQHRRTPYGYLIDEHGFVRMKGVINDAGMLQALVQMRGTRRDERAWQPASAIAEATDGAVRQKH